MAWVSACVCICVCVCVRVCVSVSVCVCVGVACDYVRAHFFKTAQLPVERTVALCIGSKASLCFEKAFFAGFS